MIEAFIGLQEAYERKKEELDVGRIEWKKRVYRELKKKGVCIDCGKKELTQSEKERGIVRCLHCRRKRRNKRYI